MALTHDDLEQIMKQEFPDFTCICEICDCGRHKHHKNCKRVGKINKRRQKQCLLTTSQETFKAFSARPRSSKRPPQTPRDPNPPPMMFKTNQRDDFRPHGEVPRVQPFAFPDTYEIDKGPFQNVTFYSAEYGPKELPSETILRPTSQGRYMRKTSAKLDTRTTNKESFKHWVPQPAIRFGELPSFTGSVLYPEQKNKLPQSTQQQSYPGAYAKKLEPCKIGEGDIKFEGAQMFVTEQRANFPGHDPKLNPMPEPFVKEDQTYRPKDGKFDGLTVTMADFTEKELAAAHVPRALAPITKLDENKPKFDGRTSFKEFYKNWNVQPRKRYGDFHEAQKYFPPIEKFDTKSTTQATYIPKEFDPVKPYIPEEHTLNKDGKLDFTTVNADTYKRPPVKLCKAEAFLIQQKLKKEQQETLRQQQEQLSKSQTRPNKTPIAAK
ncbi:stabilizer of axonemal microtubules 1-like [Lingula anatina]|uniref:Stabilizer of axonemal microtubules 1-like n=1 Tax=Lingula anatina TaxID=7574 RepID=A0A1S3H924_LINAN|nr:stabilizer of axonemal microtubules 1-like [Lingula anatina]|eukprot:XP_013382513.1 stabilizer of axonemal microtubules 1-like [Lingula anatina]